MLVDDAEIDSSAFRADNGDSRRSGGAASADRISFAFPAFFIILDVDLDADDASMDRMPKMRKDSFTFAA